MLIFTIKTLLPVIQSSEEHSHLLCLFSLVSSILCIIAELIEK